jgi:hypothetical protein
MGGTQAQHSFSGHETFPFRYPWLKKGFDAVCEDGDVFLRDDAITTLGVGKNMVRSIRYWSLAAGIIEDKRKGNDGAAGVTEFGKLLLADDGLDPYLEDPDTLWLLHWQIASNRARATTWFWAFSHYNEPEFSRDALTAALANWVPTLGGKPVAHSSLKRDVDCFLRTYVPSRHGSAEVAEESLDCPLVELNLITPSSDSQTYQFRRGRQDGLADLRELSHEYASLQWVAHQTPELETDRTARREVQARLALTQQSLRAHLEWVFSPADGDRCAWFSRGARVSLSSQRALNNLLSRLCDEVYNHTPAWRNELELVNRRSLSSAAAGARRNLIEAMLEHPAEDTLGISGTPPERSMYETLPRSSRLHRKHGGEFGFHGPDFRAETAVRELWNGIDHFLMETESTKQSVEAMFEMLRRPPFGLKDGVLPILLAAVLVHDHSQVALYEEGTFVPRPNTAVFERICRAPEKFELQRFRIAGPRAEVFQRYASMLGKLGAAPGKPDLLSVVRPLVRVVRELPDYTGKTRQISESAQRVLKTMKEARQPDRLLFDDLPNACGCPSFGSSGRVAAEKVESYFSSLRLAFAELQRAYPQLVSEIKQLIATAFGCRGAISESRDEIAHYARLVLNLAVEPKLKSFLLRLIDTSVDEGTWAESIATLLAGKQPTGWDDQDRSRFEVQLAATARTFEHFKVLAYEMERTGFALLNGNMQMLRVSITVPDGGEVERVVQVPTAMEARANSTADEVRRVLREQGMFEDRDLSVAVLAQVTRQLLYDGSGDKP